MKIFTHSALVAILLLFASATQSMAQISFKGIISGNIVDEQKSALPFATVLLKNTTDATLYKTAISNEQGSFTFDNLNAGNYFIEISMVGFEGLKKTNLQLTEVNSAINVGIIVLKASTQLLEGVTVKGQKPFIERQIDKMVVNVDQNITNAGSTAFEMMQKLPGVQMTSDGQITLNGKSGITVFIDDKPTYLSAADLASLLNDMAASNIQKIEIMTNPSAKYEAAGTGGIINIVKKRNQKEGLNGSVNGSYAQGYFGRYNGGLALSYKNKSYNFYFNNSYSYNKTFFNRTVTNDILNGKNSLLTEQISNNNSINSGKSYNPSLAMDFYLSKKTTISLSGIAAIRLTNDQTTSTMDIKDGNRIKTNQEDFTSNNQDHPSNYTASVHLIHKVDTLEKAISVDIDYSNYLNNPKQNNATTLTDALDNFINQSNVFLDQHRQLNIYACKTDYIQSLKGNAKLEVGLKSSYVKATNNNTFYNKLGELTQIDATQSSYSVNTENINAAYINFNKPYKKLTIQAGLRAEQTITKGEQLLSGQSIQQHYWQLFPTAFIDYKLNGQNGLNFKLGRRTERATYAEMVPFRRPLTPTLYFQGNPNLRPQLSYHGEITYGYHNALFITFGYDIYHDYIRTLPYLDTNKVTVTRLPTNIQGARSWNIDITYSKKLTNWWSTENTLSVYQNSFTGQTSNNFNLNNGGIPSLYLSTHNSFPINDKLSAECDFEYNSKRQLVTSTFGAYAILSLGIKQQLFGSRGAISINANNILQTEGHNAIDHYENLNQYAYWHFYTRVVRLNFTYRFGKGKIQKAHTDSGSLDEQKRAAN